MTAERRSRMAGSSSTSRSASARTGSSRWSAARTGAKAGHAGTLDPLATGVLPIALGEATKTIGYAMAGRKRYRFRIRWGVARATDDREGEITGESPVAAEPRCDRGDAAPLHRHDPADAARLFGDQDRRAPRLCAGPRRRCRPSLPARPVEIAELRLDRRSPDRDHADFEAMVGKGTYIRALARDLGAGARHARPHRRAAPAFGRAVSPKSRRFHWIRSADLAHSLAASRRLLPIETALDDIPALALTEAEAARLRAGRG